MKKVFILIIMLLCVFTYAEKLVVFDGVNKKSGGAWANPKDSVTFGVTDDVKFEGSSTLEIDVTCDNWWGGGGWNWKNWAKDGDDVSNKDFISFWIKKSSGSLHDVRLQLADADNKVSSEVRPVKSGYISTIGDQFIRVVIPLSEFSGGFNKERVAGLNMFIVPVTATGSATINIANIEFDNGDVPAPVKAKPAEVISTNKVKASTNPAAIPTKSPADWKKWKIIDHKNRAKQGNINVLFIGDSITALWNRKDIGLDAWNENFEPMGAAQFGVSGDKTQEILWRLTEGGELENVTPQVIVYLGGVNNIFTGETPDNVVGGIKATLDYLQSRLPESKIILLGLLPTGFSPNNSIYQKNKAVNKKICKFADNENIFYMDLGPQFLNADGSLKKEAFQADGVHPSAAGYEIFATGVKPEVAKLLSNVSHSESKVADFVVFDGVSADKCAGWADPTGSSFKISDSDKYDGHKTLELHGVWTAWWAGGGLNWCNYILPGSDISKYTYLTFMIKKNSDSVQDFWITLVDTDNKYSDKINIVDSGSVSDINNEFTKVSVLLSKLTGDFNKKSVWGINYGFVPSTIAGECTINLTDIIFNSDPPPVVEDLALPEGVSSPWEMNKAWKQSSDTRESICLNGLWNFIPALDDEAKENPPAGGKGWGWFKVPGIWPCAKTKAQKILLPSFYNPKKVATMDTAWYKRTITVPVGWKGRKICLDFDMIQTSAQVFVDGKEAGVVWFPGGQVDITDKIELGKEQEISILVTAKPLSAESNAFMASDRIVTTKSSVILKGITGDVYLISEPKNNSVQDVRVETSTRKGNITFDMGLSDVTAKTVSVDAVIYKAGEKVREFTFDPTNLTFKDGRISVTGDWKDAELWDTDTPQNMYEAVLTLRDTNSKILDQTLPIKFGFREFWIDGRNFYLNGSIVHLRALHGNGLAGADEASKEGALKTLKRLREYGFNSFIGGNYACKPGDVGYMEGTLEAADESGTLNSFTLPHVTYFKSKLDQPEVVEQYRELANYLIRKVQNHPSVVLYVMNHNYLGYTGDQNNQKIDGLWKPEEKDVSPNSHFYKARQQAQISEDIAISIDPSRPVYHHASGNFSQMHTMNIYLNWAPRQERSDWLEYWSKHGKKPVFFVEWGMPHVASWSSYRGPEFIWTSLGMHKIWDSEFTAPFNGDSSYEMVPEKIDLLNQEMTLWEKGEPFGYWDIVGYIQKLKHNYNDIQAWFMSDNLRSHRTWGISAFLPWDQTDLWRRVKETKTTTNPEKYKNLNQPGIVTDVFTSQKDYTEDSGEDSFEPTSTGLVMQRWNMPLLAYIAGTPTFTDKTHNYQAGKTVSKQLVIVNDSRRLTNCKYSWKVKGTDISKSGIVTTKPGEKSFVPVSFKMPAASEELIEATFDFGNGKVYQDEFEINLLAVNKPSVQSTIALYDPKGLSVKLFEDAKIPVTQIKSLKDAENYDVLVIGREAFDKSLKTILDIESFKKFARILILEQDYKTLTSRFGFRATTLGIREMAVRTPDHPALKGLSKEALSNWSGESTLVPSYMDLPNYEMSNPKVNWCGFENSRVWRCRNRNSVASVIIEKPPRGNWLPLLDCGFDMQYSPLLEYTDSKSRIIFCQVDLSGRTADEPAAEILINNLISYLETSKAPDFRTVYYDGDKQGEDMLNKLGIQFQNLELNENLPADSLLVLGPSPKSKNIQSKVEEGSNVIALGLNTAELNAILPGQVESEEKETVSYVDKLNGNPFAGISNAELHWREFPKIAALKPSSESKNPALRIFKYGKGTVVLSQAVPWTFDAEAKPYLRTTYRRNVFLTSRLLANAGAELNCPLKSFFTRPATLVKQDISTNWKVADEKTLTNPVDNCWKPEFDDSSWKTVSIPNNYGDLGYTWYRLKFKIAKGFPENVIMSLGACDDESWVWLNGEFLGEITKENAPKDYYRRARDYKLPKELIDSDEENVVVVRVNNTYLDGGMRGVPALKTKGLWLKSYYVQEPIADDDPYRYYRW